MLESKIRGLYGPLLTSFNPQAFPGSGDNGLSPDSSVFPLWSPSPQKSLKGPLCGAAAFFFFSVQNNVFVLEQCFISHITTLYESIIDEKLCLH